MKSRGNAHYRVVFEATQRCKRSANTTAVSVYRHFNAQLTNGSGRFHGRVTPSYAHKTISLQKRTCAACGWTQVRTAKTGRHGTVELQGRRPGRGRWWWRASTPASTQFITSVQRGLHDAAGSLTVQVSVPASSAARSPVPPSARAASIWARTPSSYVGRST